ncbi:transposase [Nubsella zeaxanthinifaciens]|uniref:transposase n=1 Tax=Nubsella zeaxanthinifaciens TaxID=392412 RepID=UPI000DE2C6DB|nr:transposase [Nubsella zeaxanthinifaciens]
MDDKFQNKYRIPSNRLQGFDYSSHGLYFVTICTKDRIHYFGNISSVETDNYPSQNQDNMRNYPSQNQAENNIGKCETDHYPFLRVTQIGQIAIDFWKEIPKHYPFVELDEFVIMPNHLHGILFFNRPEKSDWTENKFGSQSQNLGAVIRAFKASVKRYANNNQIKFDWQTRFHDRIIRDDRELRAVRQYIINNPEKWANDDLNLARRATS